MSWRCCYSCFCSTLLFFCIVLQPGHHFFDLFHPDVTSLAGVSVQVKVTVWCDDTETTLLLHTTRIIFYDFLHEVTLKSIRVVCQLNTVSYLFTSTSTRCLRIDQQTIIEQLPLPLSPFPANNESPTRNSLVHFTLDNETTLFSHY